MMNRRDIRHRLVPAVAGLVAGLVLWFWPLPASATHCRLLEPLTIVTRCRQENVRGPAAHGFNPAGLIRQEVNDRTFSLIVGGAVTNNAFGRVTDFDDNTADEILPDRGTRLTNSCTQGIIHPHQQVLNAAAAGSTCTNALFSMENTAGPFLRDHRLNVGILLSTVDDPFISDPTMLTGINPNDTSAGGLQSITQHDVFNFFLWNPTASPIRAEMGGFFRTRDCAPPTASGPNRRARICFDQSVQQGTLAAGGPELLSEAEGDINGPVSGGVNITVGAYRFQGDNTPLEADGRPSSTLTSVTFPLNLESLLPGVVMVHEIQNQGGASQFSLDFTGQLINDVGEMPDATYITGRRLTALTSSSGAGQLPVMMIFPGDPQAVLNSTSQP